MHDKSSPLPNGYAYVDGFYDSQLDDSFWESSVSGGVTIVEGAGKLVFATSAIGNGKISTIKKFGYQQTISVGITMVTGSLGTDGNHAEASMVLYKDATHYVKFGPYRDTASGKNTIARIQFQDGDASATDIYLSATVLDASLRQYTIAVFENKLVFIINGLAIYDLELSIFDYAIDLEIIATGADGINAEISKFICVKNTDFLSSVYQSISNTSSECVAFSDSISITDDNPVEIEFATDDHGDQFELVFSASLGKGIMPKALQDDGGVLKDYTVECNGIISRNIQPFPSVPADNDAFIIMSTSKFCYVDFYLDGGVVNSDNVIAIQYYKTTHAWDDIPGVVDGTYNVQSLGQSGRISFTPPADWDTQTLDGFTGYAIRLIITTHGVSIPLATHVQISDDTSTDFDQVASVFDTLRAYVKRKYPTIGYQLMVNDEMEYVQALGERDVDINGLKCNSNIKIGFKLDNVPDKPITINYFGFTRRL